MCRSTTIWPSILTYAILCSICIATATASYANSTEVDDSQLAKLQIRSGVLEELFQSYRPYVRSGPDAFPCQTNSSTCIIANWTGLVERGEYQFEQEQITFVNSTISTLPCDSDTDCIPLTLSSEHGTFSFNQTAVWSSSVAIKALAINIYNGSEISTVGAAPALSGPMAWYNTSNGYEGTGAGHGGQGATDCVPGIHSTQYSNKDSSNGPDLSHAGLPYGFWSVAYPFQFGGAGVSGVTAYSRGGGTILISSVLNTVINGTLSSDAVATQSQLEQLFLALQISSEAAISVLQALRLITSRSSRLFVLESSIRGFGLEWSKLHLPVERAQDEGNGGGAGGSVFVDVNQLLIGIKASISARGASSAYHGGGAGGVVSLSCVYVQSSNAPTSIVDVSGGSSGAALEYAQCPAGGSGLLHEGGGASFPEPTPALICQSSGQDTLITATPISDELDLLRLETLTLSSCAWQMLRLPPSWKNRAPELIQVSTLSMISADLAPSDYLLINATQGITLKQSSRIHNSDIASEVFLYSNNHISVASSVVEFSVVRIQCQILDIDDIGYIHFARSAKLNAVSLISRSDITQTDIPLVETTVLSVSAENLTVEQGASFSAGQVILEVSNSANILGQVIARDQSRASSGVCASSATAPYSPSVYNVTCANGTNTTAGYSLWASAQHLAVQGQGVLQGPAVRVCSYNLTIEAGSSVSAKGLGCGSQRGIGAGSAASGSPGSGAGHGGAGGQGQYGPFSSVAGIAYDTVSFPRYFGSGGGDQTNGGSGGGVVAIESEIIMLNGTISVDGAGGTNVRFGPGGGGGSGGSMLLNTSMLLGIGSITADGGNAGAFGGGGGGGGICNLVWWNPLSHQSSAAPSKLWESIYNAFLSEFSMITCADVIQGTSKSRVCATSKIAKLSHNNSVTGLIVVQHMVSKALYALKYLSLEEVANHGDVATSRLAQAYIRSVIWHSSRIGELISLLKVLAPQVWAAYAEHVLKAHLSELPEIQAPQIRNLHTRCIAPGVSANCLPNASAGSEVRAIATRIHDILKAETNSTWNANLDQYSASPHTEFSHSSQQSGKSITVAALTGLLQHKMASNFSDLALLSTVGATLLRFSSGNSGASMFGGKVSNHGGSGSFPGSPGDFGGQLSFPSCAPGEETLLCTPCMPGYWKNSSGTNDLCEPCPPGQYTDHERSTQCSRCTGDKVAESEGMRNCTLCPVNRVPTANHTECYECAPGYEGEDCTPCMPGHFKHDAGFHACEPCPFGHATDQHGSSECASCPPNQVAPIRGMSRCKPCDAGSIPIANLTSCQDCTPGKYSPGNVTQCSGCPENSSSGRRAKACMPCTLGRYAPSLSAECFDCPAKPYHAHFLPAPIGSASPTPNILPTSTVTITATPTTTHSSKVTGTPTATPSVSPSPTFTVVPSGTSSENFNRNQATDSTFYGRVMYLAHTTNRPAIPIGSCEWKCDEGFLEHPYCLNPISVGARQLGGWVTVGSVLGVALLLSCWIFFRFPDSTTIKIPITPFLSFVYMDGTLQLEASRKTPSQIRTAAMRRAARHNHSGHTSSRLINGIHSESGNVQTELHEPFGTKESKRGCCQRSLCSRCCCRRKNDRESLNQNAMMMLFPNANSQSQWMGSASRSLLTADMMMLNPSAYPSDQSPGQSGMLSQRLLHTASSNEHERMQHAQQADTSDTSLGPKRRERRKKSSNIPTSDVHSNTTLNTQNNRRMNDSSGVSGLADENNMLQNSQQRSRSDSTPTSPVVTSPKPYSGSPFAQTHQSHRMRSRQFTKSPSCQRNAGNLGYDSRRISSDLHAYHSSHRRSVMNSLSKYRTEDVHEVFLPTVADESVMKILSPGTTQSPLATHNAGLAISPYFGFSPPHSVQEFSPANLNGGMEFERPHGPNIRHRLRVYDPLEVANGETDGRRFGISRFDLADHIHRVYLWGTNTIQEPFVLPISVPAELHGVLIGPELHEHATTVSSVASPRRFTKFLYYFCQWFARPLLPIYLSRFQSRKLRNVSIVHESYGQAMLRNARARAAGDRVRFGNSADLSMAWLDFLCLEEGDDTGDAPIGQPRLPLVLPCSGDGSIFRPFRVDTEDVLVQSAFRAWLESGGLRNQYQSDTDKMKRRMIWYIEQRRKQNNAHGSKAMDERNTQHMHSQDRNRSIKQESYNPLNSSDTERKYQISSANERTREQLKNPNKHCSALTAPINLPFHAICCISALNDRLKELNSINLFEPNSHNLTALHDIQSFILELNQIYKEAEARLYLGVTYVERHSVSTNLNGPNRMDTTYGDISQHVTYGSTAEFSGRSTQNNQHYRLNNNKQNKTDKEHNRRDMSSDLHLDNGHDNISYGWNGGGRPYLLPCSRLCLVLLPTSEPPPDPQTGIWHEYLPYGTQLIPAASFLKQSNNSYVTFSNKIGVCSIQACCRAFCLRVNNRVINRSPGFSFWLLIFFAMAYMFVGWMFNATLWKLYPKWFWVILLIPPLTGAYVLTPLVALFGNFVSNASWLRVSLELCTFSLIQLLAGFAVALADLNDEYAHIGLLMGIGAPVLWFVVHLGFIMSINLRLSWVNLLADIRREMSGVQVPLMLEALALNNAQSSLESESPTSSLVSPTKETGYHVVTDMNTGTYRDYSTAATSSRSGLYSPKQLFSPQYSDATSNESVGSDVHAAHSLDRNTYDHNSTNPHTGCTMSNSLPYTSDVTSVSPHVTFSRQSTISTTETNSTTT